MAIDSVFAHWADARAEKADIAGVALMNWLPGQLLLFVISFVPVFLFALNGPDLRPGRPESLPLWTVNGLVIAGGILPAIGIALNMRFIFRGSAIPYFFIGFILMTATQRLDVAGRRRGHRPGAGLPPPELRPARAPPQAGRRAGAIVAKPPRQPRRLEPRARRRRPAFG